MENTWREELAWCAGFFDGEGWVGTYRHQKPERVRYPSDALPQLQLTLSQADRRVLDRFRAAVGVGRVFGPYGPYARGKSIRWMYRVEHLPGVQVVIAKLWRFLSPVKQAQAASAFHRHHQGHREAPARPPRTHCGAGHELTAANTLIKQSEGYTMRVCRECQRLRIKKWREAHRDYWKERQKRKLAAVLLES